MATDAPQREDWAKLESILRGSGAVFWEVDADGIFTYASSSFAELLGYEPHELVGVRHIDSFYPPVMAPELVAELLNDWLLQERPFQHDELPLVTKSGRIVWVTSRGAPFFDAAGKLKGFRGTDIDITRRREAEAKTRAADESLLLQIAAAPVAIGYTTIGSELFLTNQAFTDLFGYAPEEIPTIEAWYLHAYPDPAYREEVKQAGVEMMSRAKVGKYSASREFKVRCKDGTVRDVEVAAALVGDCFFGTFTDRTEHNRAELLLRERQDQLARVGRVSTLGQFAASLAHELEQPLGAILNNAETAKLMLSGRAPDLCELRAIVDDILADNRRAGAVLDRIRSMVRGRSLGMQAIPVEDLLHDVSQLIRPVAAKSGVALEISCQPRTRAIEGDPILLQQVLLNLVLNSLEAIGARAGGRVEIIACEKTSGVVEIAVSDNGGGVHPSEMPELFEPFHTTKGDGLGMGLPLVQSIVEQHGGGLRLDNRPGSGLTVCIDLPVHR